MTTTFPGADYEGNGNRPELVAFDAEAYDFKMQRLGSGPEKLRLPVTLGRTAVWDPEVQQLDHDAAMVKLSSPLQRGTRLGANAMRGFRL
jgi:hypothetical protein